MTTLLKVFQVEGMSCASCVAHVERVAAKLPGVQEVSVNLATANAHLTVDDTFDSQQLMTQLDKAGYPTTFVPEHGVSTSLADKQAADAQSIRAIKRDFALALLLTLPIFVLEMGSHLIPAFHHWLATAIPISLWPFQAVLAFFVLSFPGRSFFTKGIPHLINGAPDMNSLVALGSGAAFLYSLVATFSPTLLHAANSPIAISVYYEAACVIVTLVLLGRYLETRARSHTGDAITKLMQLQPQVAHKLHDNGIDTQEVAVNSLNVGDKLLVKPGERIPADGIVNSGTSSCDQSAMTGESLPLEKTTGDFVIGGTLNISGALIVEVTRTNQASLLTQIVNAVASAQAGKLPIQALVDKITLWFVPAILLIALATFSAWYFLGGSLVNGVIHGVAVLIVACPCAMGLATPTAIMVATGRAAELGVLFKDGGSLQKLAQIRAIAFDKTGTLTQGKLQFFKLINLSAHPDTALIQWAASAETQSEHPVATALVAYARAQNIPLLSTSNFNASAGGGITATIDNKEIALGNRRFLIGLYPNLPEEFSKIDKKYNNLDDFIKVGSSVLYLVAENNILGVLAFKDSLKPDACEAVTALSQSNVSSSMITGDNIATAHSIAAQLGITDVHADILPIDKAHQVNLLKQEKGTIAFVGDGINDAPALAEADVGIAMGTGTDIAMDSADVVLVNGHVMGVHHAIGLSRASMRVIKQNLFWAFAYNVLLIPLATGALEPTLGWSLSPLLAALAMALSSLLVVSNSLRLRLWA